MAGARLPALAPLTRLNGCVPLLATLAAAGSILVLAGCASDVGSGIDGARSSAASIGAGVRSSAAVHRRRLRSAVPGHRSSR